MQPTETTNDNSSDSASFERALKAMLGATAGHFGEDFLHLLIKELCQTLDLDFALIGRFRDKRKSHIESLAVFSNGEYKSNFTYELAGSPSLEVVEKGICCVSKGVQAKFPNDQWLVATNAQGYLGVTLNDSNNCVIGVLIIETCQPMQQIPLKTSVLQIFAYRVAAELERQAINKNLHDEVEINQTQLDSAPALMFMLDRQGKYLRWNRYFYSKFGYSNKEMAQYNIFATIQAKDENRVQLEIESSFAVGSGSIYLDGVTKQKEIVPLYVTVKVAEYEGQPVLVGIALDMTRQQNIEHNLLRSQGRLARKNSQLSLIITLVDKLHAIRSVKQIAEEVINILKSIEGGALLIFSVVSANGKNMQIAASSDSENPIIRARSIIPFGHSGSPIGIAMVSQKLEFFPDIGEDKRLDPEIGTLLNNEGIKGGMVIPLFHQGEALGGIIIGFKYNSEYPTGESEFYRTIGSSISLALANARQFELLESLATRDSLTGLPNRNALNKDSLVEIEQSSCNGHLIGLILVDLDRFKEINDTLDHQIGDKLLKLVGPRIKSVVNDQVSKVYRLGGDEFCVLVCNKTNTGQIRAIAESINIAITNIFVVDGLNLEIGASIGVFITQGEHHKPSEMLRCVELAMYHAKNEGGGIAIYTNDMDRDTNQRFVIMAEMAEAIRNNELVLHYQPKYDLKARQIIGCEALVRWQHKQYGLLPPVKFIPPVELTQLIHPLTYWVMKTAMAQIQQWKKQGIQINVAVNLSTRNLTDDDFINQVDSLMLEYAIKPNEIEFEVTETALMSNLDRATQQLAEFSARGIKCSLDDYGTGYSSLSYIKKLPLDILKIDRSFISLMLEDKADRTIAQSTIDLAHNLGMKVIAEGVEDENTLNELAIQGCDMIQGFFISKPLDDKSFVELYWQYLK